MKFSNFLHFNGRVCSASTTLSFLEQKLYFWISWDDHIQNRTEANQRDPMKESELFFTEDVAPRRTFNHGRKLSSNS